MTDTLGKSFLKSITWRLVSIIITIIVAYMITGDIATTGAIAGIDGIIKFIIYIIHERYWNEQDRSGTSFSRRIK